MEKGQLQNIFIEIIRSELDGSELSENIKEQITPSVVSSLYTLAKEHDLAHVLASCVARHGIEADEKVLAALKKKEIVSLYRYERINYTYEQICDILNKARIAYIPLKGSVIRPYYPKGNMRTSCDIDILVKEEDLETAIDALVKGGFECGERDYHDVSLYSDGEIHLELHFNIQETIASLDKILKNAWRYASAVGESKYEFSKEFFVFHMFAHMSYHFLGGGCGIRSLMDIWVMEKKMGVTYEDAADLLKDAGIYQFALEIHNLSKTCFDGKPRDDFSQTLLSYIFDGGVYGALENTIVLGQSRSENIVAYAFKRMFLPYGKMVAIFPILKKCPILLPFCWLARPFQMVFSGKTKKSMAELKNATAVSDESISDVKQIRERLGL